MTHSTATACWRAALASAAAAVAVTSLHVAPLDAQEVQRIELTGPAQTFPEGFSRLAGLRELPDGRVMIADGLGQVVVIADLAAGVADTIGGEGQGPEEYVEPDGLLSLPGDSTLLVDLGNGRLTAIAPDGTFGETMPIAQPAERGLLLVLPRATDRAGRIYFQQMGGIGAARRMPDSAAVVRFDRATGALDTLALVKMPDRTVSESGATNERTVMMRPVPLSAEDAWDVGADGRVAVARAGTERGRYRVEWITPDGQVVNGEPVEYRPVKIGEAEKREWVEALASSGIRVMVENNNGSLQASMSRGGGREMSGVDGYDWPEAKPAFTAAAVDVAPNGDVWVARQVAAGDPPAVDVFGIDGRLKGRIVLPRDCRIAGFGSSSVYLVRTDELDFQWLERYDLPTL